MGTILGMPKIVRFHQVGGPEVLQLEELPAPQPGEGEVRIKVEAIGLNRAEVMFRSGQYLYQPEGAISSVYAQLANGKLKPLVARTFSLDQIVEAHRFMESNEQIGKIVVTV